MLGRGLESLIPPSHHIDEPEKDGQKFLVPEKPIAGRNKSVEGPIFQIEVDKIDPNPYQPRKIFNDEAVKELAASISEFGILQPLIVTKVDKATDSGREVRYQLIAGERRLRASKLAGLERVPVIIKSLPDEREKLELAILENLQRADLSPIETARAYTKLQDQFGLTQREVAVRLGKSREVVANTIRLLSLPTYIQDAISRNDISESQGRLLLVVSDQREQQQLFNDIINNNLSVRELKSRITGRGGLSRGVRSSVAAYDPEFSLIGERLEEHLGAKVNLQRKGKGGKMTIDFYSADELQAIVDKLFTAQAAEQNDGVDGGGYPPTEEFHV